MDISKTSGTFHRCHAACAVVWVALGFSLGARARAVDPANPEISIRESSIASSIPGFENFHWSGSFQPSPSPAAGVPVLAPGAGTGVFATLTRCKGIATDPDGNVYVFWDHTSNVAITKFAPDGGVFGTVFFGDGSSIYDGRLVYDAAAAQFLFLFGNGIVLTSDPLTGTLTPYLNLNLLPIGITSAFDIITQQRKDFTGSIIPGNITFGDIDVVQEGATKVLFVSGLSIITPFVMRVDITPPNSITANVVVSTGITTAGTYNQPPGVAVSPLGIVVTTLPGAGNPVGTYNILVAFDRDFPAAGAWAEPFGMTDFVARGFTTDSHGNYYAATGPIGTTLCSGSGSGAMVLLPANFAAQFGQCFRIFPSFLSDTYDVAIAPGNTRAYITEIKTGSVVYFDINPPVTPTPTPVPTLTPTPFPTPTPTPTGGPLTLNFAEGSGNDHGWFGGTVQGFGGAASLTAGGLCMTVPGPGSNLVAWLSPERFIELAANTIYRVRVTASTDQTAANSIPLLFLIYDNFNSAGGGNNIGGISWVLDVDGGAEGIGRGQGRSAFDFYLTPNAINTPQWNSAAFTPAADAENDLRLSLRVIDANDTLVTSQDSGTICIPRVEITAISRGSLGFDQTVYNPPISSATHFAEAGDEVGIGGTSTIDNIAHSARYQLATQGAARKTLGPFDPAAAATFNAQLFPVPWEANRLYRVRARIRAESAETDPVDAVFLAMDTATVELGVEQYTTRGAPGGAMDRAASPRLTSTEYETYFFSQNATTSLTPDAGRLRPLCIFFNTTDLFGDGTGGDAFVVESLAVDRLVTPP